MENQNSSLTGNASSMLPVKITVGGMMTLGINLLELLSEMCAVSSVINGDTSIQVNYVLSQKKCIIKK